LVGGHLKWMDTFARRYSSCVNLTQYILAFYFIHFHRLRREHFTTNIRCLEPCLERIRSRQTRFRQLGFTTVIDFPNPTPTTFVHSTPLLAAPPSTPLLTMPPSTIVTADANTSSLCSCPPWEAEDLQQPPTRR